MNIDTFYLEEEATLVFNEFMQYIKEGSYSKESLENIIEKEREHWQRILEADEYYYFADMFNISASKENLPTTFFL